LYGAGLRLATRLIYASDTALHRFCTGSIAVYRASHDGRRGKMLPCSLLGWQHASLPAARLLYPAQAHGRTTRSRFIAQCVPSAEQLALCSEPWRPYLAGPVDSTRWQRTRKAAPIAKESTRRVSNLGSAQPPFTACTRTRMMLASRRD
jgi:hypothetical protein